MGRNNVKIGPVLPGKFCSSSVGETYYWPQNPPLFDRVSCFWRSTSLDRPQTSKKLPWGFTWVRAFPHWFKWASNEKQSAKVEKTMINDGFRPTNLITTNNDFDANNYTLSQCQLPRRLILPRNYISHSKVPFSTRIWDGVLCVQL